MWVTVFVCLIICISVFYCLARFHEFLMAPKDIKGLSSRPVSDKTYEKRRITLTIYHGINNINYYNIYSLLKEQYKEAKHDNESTGLYQFSEPTNSALYTYSMLLLVSLPKLPTGWSLRILTGGYWLYCLLVVTSYRASLTAILARPTPK